MRPTAAGGWTAVLAVAALGGAADAAAQTGPREPGPEGEERSRALVMAAGVADETLRVDGRLDEAAWATATPATGFVQLTPLEGREATRPTEVRILVDQGALWVGARLEDDDPDAVVARLGRRDDEVQADWFYVWIDGYRDRRTAFGFGVSAAGVQRDLRVHSDVQRDDGWDAVWDSRVRRSADGWVAEMRIPLSQLRFDRDGSPTWGVNFTRIVARLNERSHWAPMVQGSQSFVSRFGDLAGVGDLDPPRRVELLPYAVARVERAPGSAADPFYRSSDPGGSVGADLRMGVGSSMTLSATFNPDFGQVEGDPAVLNLTAFETFQQERRPFFLEGADIFEASYPSWPPLFYSRRIGRQPQLPNPGSADFTDRPRSTSILGAVKLTGKTESGWSVGLLDAVTPSERVRWADLDGEGGEAVVEPLTNHMAARVARELREGRTGIGVMATGVLRRHETDLSRARLPGSAWAFGLDGYHRFADDRWEIRGGLQASHVRGDTAAIRRIQTAPGHYYQRPDADHVELDPGRTALNGYAAAFNLRKLRGNWQTGLSGRLTSAGFEVSDLGFNPTLDHAVGNLFLRYDDYEPGSVFRSWGLGSSAMVQAATDGTVKERTLDLGFNYQLLNWWNGGFWVMRHQPAWTTIHLRGGPALRKPGRWMGSVRLASDRRKDVSGGGFLFWEAEDETDAHQINANATLTLRPSVRLDVSVGPSLSVGREAWQYVGRIGGDGGPAWLTGSMDRRTVSLSTRVEYTASPTLSVQLYARPFLATVEYDGFATVTDPSARSHDDRFRTAGVERTVREGADLLALDLDGDGAADLERNDPSFATVSAQLNAVLRWEFRPGSTLYAVWTHDRDSFGRDRYALGDNLGDLMDAPARNVFMVKMSWWVGL